MDLTLSFRDSKYVGVHASCPVEGSSRLYDRSNQLTFDVLLELTGRLCCMY